MHGIDEAVSEKTKMHVSVTDDPLTCVVRGCGVMLDDMSLLDRIRTAK